MELKSFKNFGVDPPERLAEAGLSATLYGCTVVCPFLKNNSITYELINLYLLQSASRRLLLFPFYELRSRGVKAEFHCQWVVEPELQIQLSDLWESLFIA